MSNTNKLKVGDKIDFLDYTIVYTNKADGLVLMKHRDRPQEGYECHLGNFGTNIDNAKKAAIIYFMLARPEHFATNMLYRAMGDVGCYREFSTMKEVLEKEGYALPEEITPIDGMNYLIGYKGKKITWE